jgi:hypothetical protein
MTLQLSGTINSGNINVELGKQYSSYMSIWHARNGYYGAINGQSERHPTNGVSKTNSGYAYSDWYGYRHNAVQANLNLYQRERYVDADTRAWRFRYDGQDLGQSWMYNTTFLRPWFYMPIGQRVDIYFDSVASWGSSWRSQYRRIYSNQRGYLLNVYERVTTYRNYSGLYPNSGEQITVTNDS